MKKIFNTPSKQREAHFGMDALRNIVLGVGVLSIILVAVFTLITKLSDSLPVNSSALNATNKVMAALVQIPDYLGLIVLVMIFAVVIGAVIGGLYMYGNRNQE